MRKDACLEKPGRHTLFSLTENVFKLRKDEFLPSKSYGFPVEKAGRY